MSEYSICWSPYDEGGIREASFTAVDDFEACKKTAARCELNVLEENFFDTVEDLSRVGCEPGSTVFIRGASKIKDIVYALSDGDGCDMLYYIRRPDGSYLYDSGFDPYDNY